MNETKEIVQPRVVRVGSADPISTQNPLPCPRCDSLNTKFCYYNNYNLSQPRHYCKACRRYWTHGGSLRNIPVGGVSRKKHSKRSRRATAITSSATSPTPVSDQLTSRNEEQQERHGDEEEEEEEERVWSSLDFNMNEPSFSFRSLLNDHILTDSDSLVDYGYGYGSGFGMGLTPGYDEFGSGGVGGESVNVPSELVNVGPSKSDTWQNDSGRAATTDFMTWPDISISISSSNDLVD